MSTQRIIFEDMHADDMVRWRGRLGLRQVDAGLLLDVTDRTIIFYEGNQRPIPFDTRVLCYAYEHCPSLRDCIPDIIRERRSVTEARRKK